jgi:hypothetical protein
MAKKNNTGFKTLDVVNNDPRVKEAFSEGEDGIWIWLVPGFTADPRGAHDVHEWNVRDAVRAYRCVVPCDCDACKGVQ